MTAEDPTMCARCYEKPAEPGYMFCGQDCAWAAGYSAADRLWSSRTLPLARSLASTADAVQAAGYGVNDTAPVGTLVGLATALLVRVESLSSAWEEVLSDSA